MSKDPKCLKRKKGGNLSTVVIIVFLSIVALMQMFPFFLQFVSSVQHMDFLPEAGKIYLWPEDGFHLENYLEAIERVGLLDGVVNSVIVATGFSLLSAVVILLVGYVMGKKQFHGKKLIHFAMLLTMVVPGELLMITNYKLVSDLGWTNSYAGMVLPGIVNITGIFLVVSFMNTVPDAVLESAEIDGANEAVKLFRIVLPLVMPVLATYFILTFVGQWNDYLWPMVVVQDSDLFTIQLKLKEFDTFYGSYSDEILRNAAAIFTIVPVLVVYLTCQKQFVSGISVTGMK